MRARMSAVAPLFGHLPVDQAMRKPLRIHHLACSSLNIMRSRLNLRIAEANVTVTRVKHRHLASVRRLYRYAAYRLQMGRRDGFPENYGDAIGASGPLSYRAVGFTITRKPAPLGRFLKKRPRNADRYLLTGQSAIDK